MEKEHKACEARYQSLSAEASALRQVSGRGCLCLHRPVARGHDVLHVARHPHVACVRACAPNRTCRTLRRVCSAQEKEAKIRNLQQRYAREQVGTPTLPLRRAAPAPIPLGKRARSYSHTDARHAAARPSARSRRGVWRLGCLRGVGWGTQEGYEGYSRGLGWGTRSASLCAAGASREGRGEPQEAAGRPRCCARRERRGARQRQGASVRRHFGLARRR
jgi:hypothetical protein